MTRQSTILRSPRRRAKLAEARRNRALDPREVMSLVVSLATALHRAGAPAHRLEDMVERLCRGLGVEGQILADPTSLTVAIGRGDAQQVRVSRLPAPGLDLGRMVALEAIAASAGARKVRPRVAEARVEAVMAARPRYGRAAMLAASGAVCGACALFLGGGAPEMVAGAILGVAVAGLALLGPRFASISELLAALVCGAGAPVLLWLLDLGGNVWVTTAAGLIMLVPGYTLTVALTEVATHHLASGTARLAMVVGTLLTLGFGVAVGGRLGAHVHGGAFVETASLPLPGVAEWIALVVATLGLGVQFGTRARDLGWVLAAGVGAYVATLAGAAVLGPELGAFAGAAAVGTGANAFARWRRRPAALILVPGIIMLVPGSVGFRSVDALLRHDVLSGIETGFEMGLIAASLVAGLLMANTLVPPHRDREI